MQVLIRTEQLRAAFKALACLGLPVERSAETNMLRVSLDTRVVSGGPLRYGFSIEAVDGPRYLCIASTGDAAPLEQIIVSRNEARFLVEYLDEPTHQTRVEIAGSVLKFDMGGRQAYVLKAHASPETFPNVSKLFEHDSERDGTMRTGYFDPSYVGEIGGIAAHAFAAHVELTVSPYLLEAKMTGERLFARYLVAPRRT